MLHFGRPCHCGCEGVGTKRLATVDDLTRFLRANLSHADARRFLEVVFAGRPAAPTTDDPYEDIRLLAAAHLDPGDISRYLDELKRRLLAGEPLIRKHTAPPTVDRRPTPPTERLQPALSADELLERRRQSVRRLAKERHAKNRQTDAYRKVRERRLQLANHRCERNGCGSSEKLELHHNHYETLGRERLGDVIILCSRCHAAETERQAALARARWRPYSRRGITFFS